MGGDGWGTRLYEELTIGMPDKIWLQRGRRVDPNNPLMKFCCFLDSDRLHPKDSTGFNKVGYITSSGMVIFPFRRRFVSKPLQEFKGIPLELNIMAISDERMQQVDLFFRGNVLNPTLMGRAFNAICRGALDFFDDPIKLPMLNPITHAERLQRWEKALSVIEIGDLVQIVDQRSMVSRFIAKIDRGCWSHTAGYVGEGQITEAITSGVTERPIEVYNKDSIRLGVYRMDGIDAEHANIFVAHARSRLGNPYGWLQAFRTGVEKVFRYSPERKPTIPSPNDLIVWSDCIKLIALV